MLLESLAIKISTSRSSQPGALETQEQLTQIPQWGRIQTVGAQRRQGSQLEGSTLREGVGLGTGKVAFEQISAGVEGGAEESRAGTGSGPWGGHPACQPPAFMGSLQPVRVKGCGHASGLSSAVIMLGPCTVPLPVPSMFLFSLLIRYFSCPGPSHILASSLLSPSFHKFIHSTHISSVSAGCWALF